jgi:hypothetical protein
MRRLLSTFPHRRIISIAIDMPVKKLCRELLCLLYRTERRRGATTWCITISAFAAAVGVWRGFTHVLDALLSA